MNKVLTLSWVLLIATHAFSTVRTVSNNPSTLGQFSVIQPAIDASLDGDTVYVYGSPNQYDAFIIQDKKITVIGPGWAPDKNLPLVASVFGATIRDSPAGGSPSGSELHGLYFTSTVNIGKLAVGGDFGVNNLRIIRCQFPGALQSDLNATGLLFEGNVFWNALSFSTNATYQNLLFQNNYFFMSVCCLGSVISGFNNTVNVRFDHNLFVSSNNGGGSSALIFASNNRFLSLSNNIFNQSSAGAISFSTFNNNITNNITLNVNNGAANGTPWAVNSNVDGGGNVENQNPEMVDQVSANAGNSSPSLNYSISSGPANNSGSDGKDMGLLFDVTGSLNWNNSRNSRLPRIFSMNITTPTITPGGTISVTVQAKKSN